MTGFNLADLFELVAGAVPERVAVVCGAERRTYSELDARATRLAHALADRGVRPGAHVGCYLHDSIAHVEIILACYKLRAVPINVNYRYVGEEVRYLCDDAGVVVLFHDADLTTPMTALEVDLIAAGDDAYEGMLRRATLVHALPSRSGDDHYVLYTGGTTGMPKGVVWRQEDIFFAALGGGNPGGPPISHPAEIVASVLHNPAQRLRPLLPDADPGPEQFVSLASGPLVHASGQWSVLGTLLGGGRAVLNADRHFDVARVLDLIERERVNACNLVGDATARPMLHALRHEPGRWDTASLRLLGSGGSILSAEVRDGLLAALPSVIAIIEGIGSSESPAQAVAVTTRSGTPSRSLTFAPKAETMVVDDDLRPVPTGRGVVGRLATRGRVPIGYHRDPERTARTFVEIDGQRWALPGDMATVDRDGTIHLLGRGSLCINSGGEKVYPEEVEAVLKDAPGVADAVVIGVPDERYGERVVAIVSCAHRDDPPDLDAVRAHCRTRLAGYKLPRELRIVEEVVRSPAGKADYGWARNIAAGPSAP